MSRKRKIQDKAQGSSPIKAAASVLGDVQPGNWATLGDGTEVMVSWHQRGISCVRRGSAAPEPMPSDTQVFRVRERQRAVVQSDAVADPVGGSDGQRLFKDMPLLAKTAGGA